MPDHLMIRLRLSVMVMASVDGTTADDAAERLVVLAEVGLAPKRRWLIPGCSEQRLARCTPRIFSADSR